MQTKRLRASAVRPSNDSQAIARRAGYTVLRGKKLRGTMPRTNSVAANSYLCAVEKNQNGKYNVRLRASFPASSSGSSNWTLRVYFLASSFNGAMKKVEESLQAL